jgi:hypothetical protein
MRFALASTMVASPRIAEDRAYCRVIDEEANRLALSDAG